MSDRAVEEARVAEAMFWEAASNNRELLALVNRYAEELRAARRAQMLYRVLAFVLAVIMLVASIAIIRQRSEPGKYLSKEIAGHCLPFPAKEVA